MTITELEALTGVLHEKADALAAMKTHLQAAQERISSARHPELASAYALLTRTVGEAALIAERLASSDDIYT